MTAIPLGGVVGIHATTHNPETGAAADADSPPSAQVYHGAATVGEPIALAKLATGLYGASLAATAGNGFSVGSDYAVVVSATVGGLAANRIARQFRVVLDEGSPGVPRVDAGLRGAKGRWVELPANGGSDAADGKTPWTPKATVQAAINDAGAGGCVGVGVGTFSESVDASAATGLSIFGCGWATKIYSDGNDGRTFALKVGSGTAVADLHLQSAHWETNAGPGLRTDVGATGVHLENVLARGVWDGMLGSLSGGSAVGCVFVGAYDGANLDLTGAVVDDTWFVTTSELIGATVGTRGLLASATTPGRLARCRFVNTRETANDAPSIAVETSGALQFVDCEAHAAHRNAAGTGDVVGYRVGSGTIEILGGAIATRHAGGRTERHIQVTSGAAIGSGVRYDPAKTAGEVDVEAEASRDAAVALTLDAAGVETRPLPEHSLYTLLLAALESSVEGETWTIRKTGGAVHVTKALTTDAAAEPITGVS